MEMEMKKEREGGDRGDRPMVSDEGPSGRTAKMKFMLSCVSCAAIIFISFSLSLFHSFSLSFSFSRSIRFDIFQEFV